MAMPDWCKILHLHNHPQVPTLLKHDIKRRNHQYQDVQTVKSALIKHHRSQKERYNREDTLTDGKS